MAAPDVEDGAAQIGRELVVDQQVALIRPPRIVVMDNIGAERESIAGRCNFGARVEIECWGALK